jgi:hypothetical protein
MKAKTLKTLVLGALAAYIFAGLVLVSFAKLGALPVQADAVPGPLETGPAGDYTAGFRTACLRRAAGTDCRQPGAGIGR